MSVIAIAVKHLLAAGVTGDALVAAIAEMENAYQIKKRVKKTQHYKKRLNMSRQQWKAIRKKVFERDGEACLYCDDRTGPFHIDHIMPLSLGGNSDLDNLCVACRSCNTRKSDKHPNEWRASLC